MVQATWAKLLHLYTGENDVCFGNVVSGRSLSGEDLGHLVAPCFNTLPVRVSFGCQSTNIALVGQAHAFNIASLAHQLTPLRRIQRIALADRGGTLFDTLVILQQVSEPVDVSIWTLECDLGEMDLPLVCEIFQHHLEDALELVLHYHGSVLSETEAEIVADTYDVILTRLIEHPLASAQNIIGLPLPLQSVSNMDHRPRHIGNNYLHSGFEYNAHSNPHRTALEFLHADGVRTTWTYRILNEKANVIAHTLIANGVKPDDIIPIHIAKSPLFYASVLGVLKAGAAFVPVHPDLPDARKRHMFEELQAWLILVTNNCALPDEISCSRLLNVAVLDDNLKGNPSVPNMSGLNLAYCLFTSGSTGVPKAVSMEHHSPMQTIECSNSLVPWNSSSRLLQYADITFDMCYYDFFLTCTFGFTLCAAEQHMMLNDLTKTINSLDVDLLDLTPSVASSIMRSEVPQVKWLYCIGEAMLPAIVKQWEGACVNSFGPTETAFCTTIHSVSTKLKTSVIGRPFPSTSFAVFSPGGERPLPLLSVGELYIGGAQLARGYHGRSELTDEKFVSKCGQRFYRSGDVVRMLSDGTFEFIGRADDQVKIRGLRVELGEVNHVLQRSHPDIAAAVTQILKKDAGSKEQLVAFLVARPAIVDDAHEDIRNHLRCAAEQHLPAYMIPQFFLFIEKIPISMAGKIDRKALADIFKGSDAGTRSDSSLEQVVHHRWSKLESQIRNVLAQLSKTSLQNISPSATIYQLGLDSISAVQIATSLRRKGYPVSAADVMRYTSCVDLANYLTRAPTVLSTAAPRFDFDQFDKKYRKQVLAKCNIDSKDLDAIRPCTPLQRGMISQFLAKDGTVYLNYLRLRLHHDLDFGAMREAWNTIMKSHPILRTGFVHLDEKEYPFVMVHYGPDVITLPWRFDNSPETIDHWLQKLQRRGITELHRPLWEIRPITEHDINYLDIAIFHPLFDAHSLQIILRDVVAIHRGELAGIPISLEPVVDAILHLSSDHGEQGTTFWTNLGNGATTCRFPNLASLKLDPVPPEVCVHRSAQALALMKHGCQLANTTLQAAGIASWLYLLSAYTGEREVACGVVLSGRTLEAVEDAVFPCINTVPFVHTITADLKETLIAVTALNADIQQHQHVPLSDIQRSMGFPNEALFDTIFAYQRLTHDESKHDFWSIVDEKATIEYPVSIELEPRGEYLEYRLTFLPHLIPRKQAALILAQFDHLISRFIVPEIGVETFDKSLYSITPAKETTLPSHARLLHELVELTTVQFPQRIAFEFAHTIHAGRYSGQSWTYSELDTAGNQIAHLLITNGVQPGDLVGVCFDKCPEASFAMLGVLKAGCAFVAIDPGAPAARQKFR
jgi:amino acid adenylation domain-containing protein